MTMRTTVAKVVVAILLVSTPLVPSAAIGAAPKKPPATVLVKSIDIGAPSNSCPVVRWAYANERLFVASYSARRWPGRIAVLQMKEDGQAGGWQTLATKQVKKSGDSVTFYLRTAPTRGVTRHYRIMSKATAGLPRLVTPSRTVTTSATTLSGNAFLDGVRLVRTNLPTLYTQTPDGLRRSYQNCWVEWQDQSWVLTRVPPGTYAIWLGISVGADAGGNKVATTPVWYGDAATSADAALVTVTGDEPSITGLDVNTSLGTQIQIVVKNRTLRDNDFSAVLKRVDDTAPTTSSACSGWTCTPVLHPQDEDPFFTPPLAPGTYKMLILTNGIRANTWYGDSYTQADATTFTVGTPDQPADGQPTLLTVTLLPKQ